MTQEEKQILLKDLCMRIPYRTFVCLNPGAYNKPEKCLLTGVDEEQIYLNVDSDPFRIDHIKPYLRPMSGMTKEECKELGDLPATIENVGETLPNIPYYIEISRPEQIDWLNAHHFDYRGLIDKGLALEAPEGMYKTK